MKGRSTAFIVTQAIGYILIGLVCWSIVSNMTFNLDRLGIQIDWRFLTMESGFGITQKWLDHNNYHSNLNVLLVGLINTLVVSFAGIVLSSLIGIVVALGSYSHNPLLRSTAGLYINVFRNVPLLIQILFWYNLWILKMPSVKNTWFGYIIAYNNRGVYLPSIAWRSTDVMILLGLIAAQWVCLRIFQYIRVLRSNQQPTTVLPTLCVLAAVTSLAFIVVYAQAGLISLPKLGRFNVSGYHIYPEFIGLLAGLSLYTAAYNAETIRGAINAVPQGQREATEVLTLSPWLSFTKVIVPQALPGIMPPLASHYMNLAKNSSLGLAVGYPEMFAIFAGTVLNQTGRAIEIISIIMAIYLIISIMIITVMNAINQRQSHWKGIKQN